MPKKKILFWQNWRQHPDHPCWQLDGDGMDKKNSHNDKSDNNDELNNSDESTASPSIPFVYSFPFTYGIADQLTPRITRLIANNPGPYTYSGTGTYIISKPNSLGEAPSAIIDPGPDDIEHIDNLLKLCDKAGVSHIVITHTHSDHCGGAKTLQKKCGAPIYAFSAHPVDNAEHDAPALDEGADYHFAPDYSISDGDIIKGDDWSLEAVHTPGHLSNHLCFALIEEKILFTGDHMMGWATTVIAPPDGDMGDYFNSLDKLLGRDDIQYLPTHGAPIDDPHAFVRAVRMHRLMRDGQILTHLADGPAQIKDIVASLYANVDKRLHMAAGLNVLAHLIRLKQIGDVTCDGNPSLQSLYQLKSSV